MSALPQSMGKSSTSIVAKWACRGLSTPGLEQSQLAPLSADNRSAKLSLLSRAPINLAHAQKRKQRTQSNPALNAASRKRCGDACRLPSPHGRNNRCLHKRWRVAIKDPFLPKVITNMIESDVVHPRRVAEAINAPAGPVTADHTCRAFASRPLLRAKSPAMASRARNPSHMAWAQ